MDELHERYKDKDVEFFVVYSKEPHAQERKYFKKYTQHSSFEHKMGYAKELVAEFGMKISVLVDDVDEAVVNAYGRMPNMVFVIDKDGNIAYKASAGRSSRESTGCSMNCSPSRPSRPKRR